MKAQITIILEVDSAGNFNADSLLALDAADAAACRFPNGKVKRAEVLYIEEPVKK